MSSLRGQLVKSFMTLLPNSLIFTGIVEKIAKASHIFSIKNIVIFQIFTFEILTRR